MAENLKSLIKLYFLRRTKDEIWGDKKENGDIEELETKMENMAYVFILQKQFRLLLTVKTVKLHLFNYHKQNIKREKALCL